MDDLAITTFLPYQIEWMHYCRQPVPRKRFVTKGPVCTKRDATKRKGKAKQFTISRMSHERKVQFLVDELGF